MRRRSLWVLAAVAAAPTSRKRSVHDFIAHLTAYRSVEERTWTAACARWPQAGPCLLGLHQACCTVMRHRWGCASMGSWKQLRREAEPKKAGPLGADGLGREHPVWAGEAVCLRTGTAIGSTTITMRAQPSLLRVVHPAS